MSIQYKNIRDMGMYEYVSGQITIKKGLKPRYEPSRLFVIEHELYHKYLDDKKHNIGGTKEEILCDVWAIMKLKSKQLSFGDAWLKKIILRKFGRITKAKLYKLKEDIYKLIKFKEK